MSLSKIALLDELTVLEVFAYYDQPVLFACQNEAGRQFMAVLVDEGIEDRWLYAEVSTDRLTAIRRGEVDFHDAFALTESGALFDVRISRQTDTATVRVIEASGVPDDDLPLRGETA